MNEQLITPDFDVRAFRNALGNFLTGVTIVCTRDAEDQPRGFTANSFTSVSLEPPLILVCIGKAAASYETFLKCESFSVNILSEAQKDVSTTFASKSPDKFQCVQTITSITGAPIIDGSLSWFDCRSFDRVDAGDHLILIGQVETFHSSRGQPLGYWGGGYVTLGLEAEATRIEEQYSSTYVGCIVDYNGRILLTRNQNQSWSIPTAPIIGQRRNHQERIDQLMFDLGIRAEASFLYSVFEVPGSGRSFIIYRAELTDSENRGAYCNASSRFFGPAELPWDALPNPEVRAMLKRYFRERNLARFGVYSDAGLNGCVATLLAKPKHWRESEEAQATPSTQN